MRHEGRPEGLWISVTARPLDDEHGGHRGGVVVFRDITARKRSEQRRAAQHATTRILAEAGTLDEAAPKILEAIGDGPGLGLRRAVAGGPRRPPAALRGDLAPAGVAVARFEAQTRQMTFAPGVGLPGRVWDERPAGLDRRRDAGRRLPPRRGRGRGGAARRPSPSRSRCGARSSASSSSSAARPGRGTTTCSQMVASLGSQIGLFFERQPDARAGHPVGEAGLARPALGRRGARDQQPAGLRRQQPGRAGARRPAAWSSWPAALRGGPGGPGAGRRRAGRRRSPGSAEEIDCAYVRENLERIVASTRDGVKRVADIVQNLRGFARLDRAAIDRVDIHDAITSSLEMIRGRLDRRNIAVELRVRRRCPRCRARPRRSARCS